MMTQACADTRRAKSRNSWPTSTVTSDGRIVPWLSASGPLSYTPESPPERDYFFQYNWIMPDIFAPATNRRQRHLFGAEWKDQAREILSFWDAARRGDAVRLAYVEGSVEDHRVTAPVAAYHSPPGRRGPECVLIQHGSYQIVELEDQPLLRAGEVMLYRGVQKANRFRFVQNRVDESDLWRRYLAVQAYVLSDSVRSFNSIHDRASRCETSHINDRSWMTDELGGRNGLDLDREGHDRAFWESTHQSFSLARWVADRKFGPNYVVCRTPLDNIRLTTFFAGEHEVRMIDPTRVTLVEGHGCRVEAI
jgi:hypothetical protein